MNDPKKPTRLRMVTALVETFGLNPTVASVVAFLILLAGLLALLWIVRSAPPRTLVLSSGPPGSSFQQYAERYAKILARNGVTLEVRPSDGSLENLQRLAAPHPDADIGFVQAGLARAADLGGVISLGSIAHEPIWIFYRGPRRLTRLAELAGQRIAVGALGSGTHTLALTLLKANDMTGGHATLLDLDTDAAVAGLLEGRLDAIFLMGDSASIRTVRTLVRSPDVQLYAFAQADAYVRRFPYLNRIDLPQGSIDLGRNLPGEDVVLIGPTVDLVARKGLHPALSDLLIEAAQEIHGRAGLLQRRGEFPAPQDHEIAVSDDALRYYKSGKGLLNRIVGSFWIASFLNRILVVFVPTVLILIPGLRLLPIVYRWRIQLRIYRCYRLLLRLEWEVADGLTGGQREELLRRLDEIELDVNRLKVPAYFADQFYGLRGHIAFVRARLQAVPAG